MKKQNLSIIVFVFLICTFLYSNTVFANKSLVSIEAPASVKKGTEVTIRINIEHDGNNFLHYTEWVYVKINGKEASRWEYSNFSRPESEKFTKELKYVANEELKIQSEAGCNIHGSRNKAEAVIYIK